MAVPLIPSSRLAPLSDSHRQSPSATEGGEGGARNARRVGRLRKGDLSRKALARCFRSNDEYLWVERPHPSARWAATLPALRAAEGELALDYFGARLARIRCKVRRCMLSRRAVSETLRLHNS